MGARGAGKTRPVLAILGCTGEIIYESKATDKMAAGDVSADGMKADEKQGGR